MRAWKREWLAAAACAALLAVPALADDWQAPPWRGLVSTTLQWWEFGTNQSVDIAPDGPGPLDEGPPYQVGYLPSTKIIEVVPDPANPTWLATDPFGSTREGIWPLSGTLDVIVDNHNPPNIYKEVWVQLTWHYGDEQHPQERPALVNLDPSPVGGITEVAEECWCFGWVTTVYSWRLEPNPPDEKFRIQGDILIDQLVVDTWCIPEPATLSLLVCLGLFLPRKRR